MLGNRFDLHFGSMNFFPANIRSGLVAGLLAATIWGGMYVVSKVVLESVPPFVLLSLRLLLGFAALLIWQLKNGGLPRLALIHTTIGWRVL